MNNNIVLSSKCTKEDELLWKFNHFGCHFLSILRILLKVSKAVTCKAMETKKFILLVAYTVLKNRLFYKWEEFDYYSSFLKATSSESNLKSVERHIPRIEIRHFHNILSPNNTMLNIFKVVLKYAFLKQIINQVVTGQNSIFYFYVFMKLLPLTGLQLNKIPQNHQASP